MPRHLLTAKQIIAVRDRDLVDGEGLIVRVKGISCTAVLRFNSPVSHKRRELGLGLLSRDSLQAAGETLVAARVAAEDARRLILDGLDPIEVRGANRAEARAKEEAANAATKSAAMTLRRFARNYHDEHVEPLRSTRHAQQWINSIECNVRDQWKLPPRNQLAQLFLGRVAARVTHAGALAIPVDREREWTEITEPSDEDFFAYVLHQPAMYAYPDVRAKERYEVPYTYSRPSDKGRYLLGALGMFGSISRAYQVLMHSFWREQFAKLIGKSEDHYPRIIATLKKRFAPQGGTFTFEREEQWESLARTVVSQAFNVRQPKSAVKLESLVWAWTKHLERAIEVHASLREQKDAILERAPRDLADALKGLCVDGIFHQGYSWVCGRCAYRNWIALDALRVTLECQVCRNVHGTPVDLKFDFRFNEFLASCLREHDTLSVVWALGDLQESDRPSSFIFAPQTELFRNWPEEQDNRANQEIDILCVIDGKVMIGEVKASIGEINDRDLGALASLAGELRADGVLLGALKADQRSLKTKVDYLRSQVAPGIEVRGLLFERGPQDIEHFLP